MENKNGLLKDFDLVFLPLRAPRAEHRVRYQQAMTLWRGVWEQVNRNFKIQDSLFLDSFLRQDEAACLFTPKGCAGLILFRTLDFSFLDYRSDSYFKEWTDLDIAKLHKHGSRTFLSNNLSVHPEYRAFLPDLKFKEVLLDVMILRFLQSTAHVISGITRRDRAINDVSLALGATMIRADVEYFNGRERVDLVGFYRANVKRSPNAQVRAAVDELWSRRLDLVVDATREPRAA